MSRTVVFLGAGASKAFGVPLTNELFPNLLEKLCGAPSDGRPLFKGDQTDQRRLKQGLLAIFPGLIAPPADEEERRAWRKTVPLITDVLSAIDYLLLSGNAPHPGLTLADLAQVRVLLERAVFELLVRHEPEVMAYMKGVPSDVENEWAATGTLEFLRSADADGRVGKEKLVSAARWLLDSSKAGDRISLISTNYDIELDQALYTELGYHSVFRRVDFGTAVREPVEGTVYRRPRNPRIAVYKLHGSFNWLRCDLCDNIYVNPVGAIAYLSFLLGDDRYIKNDESGHLKQLEEKGANRCHCGFRPLRHVIVAPSFVRDVRDPILLEVWRSALEALRQADHWIIIGYSLPTEDLAIRSMLLRAYRGRDTPPPRVTVVQKEKKEPELSRYNLLFPGTRHDFRAGGLEEYLEQESADQLINPT